MHARGKDGTELIGQRRNLAKKEFYAILVITVMANVLNRLKIIDGFVQAVILNSR